MYKTPVTEFIALDCETTGLDPRTADIIEIALVRFKGRDVSEKTIHFVKPDHPIPLRNKRLTGIDDEMVRNAPAFSEIAAGVAGFIGDLPLVGHNITFDLRFLNHKLRLCDLEQLNIPTYDTLRIAALFFPEEPSLKLKLLADKFGIESDESHRAEADAELAGQLFLDLKDYILKLPAELINLLAGMGPADDNSTFHFLNSIRQADVEGDKAGIHLLAGNLSVDNRPSTYPAGDMAVADDIVAASEAAFKADGCLASLFEGFAHRPGQPEMSAKFAEYVVNGGINAVEAGCGLGKSPAYLLPAVLAAGRGIKPIVISTYTKNLQDQLASKDLPALAPLQPGGLKFTTLKGRASYICLSRVLDSSGRLYGAGRLSPYEKAVLLSWIHRTREGDIDRLNYFILNNYNNLKSHLNFLRAEGEFCNLDDCRWRDKCFVRASRKRAAASDIIITNHALFFAGFEPEGDGPQILPEFKHVIFDEAHHIEDAVAQSLRLSFDTYIATRLIKRFSDLLGKAEFDGIGAEVHSIIQPVPKRLIEHIKHLAHAGEGAVRRLKTSGSERYAPQLVLTPEATEEPAWDEFRAEAASFLLALGDCRNDIEKAAAECGKRLAATRLTGFSRLLGNIEETVRCAVEPDFVSNAIWLDTPPSGKAKRLRINIRPLSVAEHFGRLASALESCQFTSATLSALGRIEFFTSSLGLDGFDVEFSSYPAPFDMPRQARIFIPTDLDPPSAPDSRIWEGMRGGYVERTSDALRKIILRFGGHALCLFTSIQDMDDIGEFIRPDLEDADINCLMQFRDGGKSALIEEFSNDPRTALLGTRSFFEGVDIPNRALKCLVIARLPFPHPDEPVHFSRLRKMAEDGVDGFANLSLPLANLSLRQAVGRLIRTPNDKGVVIFLDNRLISKSYGEALLNGLESIPCEVGALDDIIEAAASFAGL